MKKVLYIFSLVLLFGCTNRFQEYPSSSVDVIPLKTTLKIDIRIEGWRSAKSNIDLFIKENREQLLRESVHITYSNYNSKKLADYVYKLLLKKGANPLSIKLVNNQINNSTDFEVSFTEHKVQVPLCGYEQIEKLGEQAPNCVVEGARWKSMLHPEKMLLPQS